jgi:type VI secretion system protein VasI
MKRRSKLDDSENVYLQLKADDPIQTPFKGLFYPELLIRCRENKTSMVVNFNMFLSNDDLKVTYRIDKERARNVWWNTTTNFDALYVLNPISLIRKLKDEDQIYIQVTPYGQSPIDTTFYVHGLFNAIKPIQEACEW